MKCKMLQAIVGLLLGFILNFYPNNLNAVEVDNGLVIVDRKPWKISWIQENENVWVLIANFEKRCF